MGEIQGWSPTDNSNVDLWPEIDERKALEIDERRAWLAYEGMKGGHHG